jgi:cytochrome b involved in lipid metabolism
MSKLKLATLIVLSGFFLLSAGVIVAGKFAGNQKKTDPVVAGTNSSIEKTDITNNLTSSEVTKHNSPTNCWMIISQNVYDFTSFLQSHPGGEAIMQPFCGKDATAAYQTMGGMGRSHSTRADEMMRSYSLGKLQ